MTKVDIDSVTNVIREVAIETILPRFRNLESGDVSYKVGDDPVTIADQEAEKGLSSRLSGLLEGSKVVGEEAFAANRGVLDLILGESPVWIVDPIDGTRNFVRGSPEFGVIVALAEQNQVIAGWLYDPTSDEVITTERGSGAWYKGERLKVAAPVPLEKMGGLLSDRLRQAHEKVNPARKENQPVIGNTWAAVHQYPRLVLDQPHFGKNEPQLHFRASMAGYPWDDAAGVLAHQEAGGYSAMWNEQAYVPSAIGQGLLLSPDRESWQTLKTWCLNRSLIYLATEVANQLLLHLCQSVKFIRRWFQASPDRIGPGGILRKTRDHMDMQLRYHIAECRDIDLVWRVEGGQRVRCLDDLLHQLRALAGREFENLFHIIVPRNEDQPRARASGSAAGAAKAADRVSGYCRPRAVCGG